ncbi:hypothetical protein C8F01DRAFT_1176133, partial [Mycena amicta]
MTLLWLLDLTLRRFVLRVIRLANHFDFAVCPNGGHATLGVTDVANLVREAGVRDIGFQFPAVYANTLQYLLNLQDETWVENGARKLNVAEVTWTFRHPLATRLTLEVTVDGSHAGVHKAAHLGFTGGLVHDFGVFYLRHRVRFDFLRREDTELDLFDLADGGSRKGELVAEHDGKDRDDGREEAGRKGGSNGAENGRKRREKTLQGRISGFM